MILRKNGASLERLNIVFENSLPKGFFFDIIRKIRILSPDSRCLLTTALNRFRERMIKSCFFLRLVKSPVVTHRRELDRLTFQASTIVGIKTALHMGIS